MDPVERRKRALRIARTRRVAFTAIERTLAEPVLREAVRTFLETLYADLRAHPGKPITRRIARAITDNCRFVCQCGKVATRIVGLIGHCEAHGAAGMHRLMHVRRNKLQRSALQGREIEEYLRTKDSVKKHHQARGLRRTGSVV
jgi:hypothetical protein